MKNGMYIECGDKYWYKDGLLHREDGPAIEHRGGSKSWFINGEFHREDGPCFESDDGIKGWCLNGERIYVSSNEEFLRIVKLRAFL